MSDNSKNTKLNCVRKKLNWSSISKYERFDKETFDPTKTNYNLSKKGPKINLLLQNIIELDERDLKHDKKLYKHFIFTSVPESAKLLTSVFISCGFLNVIKLDKNKIELDKNFLKEEHSYKVVSLSSTSLFNVPSVNINKESILNTFNDSNNINGSQIRFIILDQGFLEGVDLMDVKYCHILEETWTDTILKQALGRGKRFCGQKNLPYIKNRGWELDCFIYRDYVENKNILKLLKDEFQSNFEENFKNELSFLLKDSAFDKELTTNLHNYRPREKNSSYKLTWKQIGKATGVLSGLGISIYTLYKIKTDPEFYKKASIYIDKINKLLIKYKYK